jgi:uncharacterized protein (TIGR02677 family)
MPGRAADFSVFAHLNADKCALYRAILGVFAQARKRFTIVLRPAEVAIRVTARAAAESQTSDPSAEMPAADVEAALAQLVTWGNLESPDTAEVATVEEFHRPRRLYQLSAAGGAAERALAVFEEYNRNVIRV